MLRGRETERAAVAALLDEAWASRGGALVVRGLPGAGKSALLTDATVRAEGMQVLTSQGIESESPLAFAALHRLLRPVMRHADGLPEPQSHALRAAFGETEGDGGDRFRVFLATLNVLAATAEHGPVLAVVDDAHWLDDASAAALLFVARRLRDERVAVLFAAREGDVRSFDSGDLPSLFLSGVDEDAAGALLSDRAGVAVPPRVRDRLVHSTGGMPLALVELADALPVDQLSGRVPLPAQLPLTEGVERVFLDRYRRLPDQAQALLLVMAADDSGRLRIVQDAAAALGAGEDALDAVERSGLVRVRDGEVALRHPLVRSAVYGAATTVERRRVHQSLADALVHTADADRRAWHRAAATVVPDEAVVQELDAAAERARSRGGLEAAAAAWERAAELTRDDEPRAQRLYAAARVAWLAGQAARAQALTEAAHRGATDPGLRADAARLRARIEWNVGSLHLGHRMVMHAAKDVAPFDADRAREMAMFGAALEAFGADSGVGIDPVEFAAAEAAGSVRTRCYADLLLGLDHVTAERWDDAVPLLRHAFALTRSLDDADQDLLPNLGIAALHLGDDAAGRRYHEMLRAWARETGAIFMVRYSLARLGLIELAAGHWASASANASQALELAEGTGRPGLAGLPLACLTLLAAFRGEEAYDARLAEVEQIASAHPTGIMVRVIADLIRWAKGITADHPVSAFGHLEQISHGMVRRMAAIDRIEAAVRADRHDVAATWMRELDAFATATGAAWATAAASHGRALLADGADAATHFAQALEQHADSTRVLGRARTQLAYGELLRRSRRRVDARAQLRAALETFEDLGARPWAERAAQELRASGETARRRDPSTISDLTPQELQVARLVRSGLSNRDAATQLYLSPRTIDFHLRNTYAKLGVSSRVELAQLPLD